MGRPAVFDPHAARTQSELTVADLVFDGLYRIDRTGSPALELATSLPIVSDDKLKVEIPIRVGAFFHDGSALTALDVVASLRRLKHGSAGWLVGAVSTIEASEDGKRIVLQLRYPTPSLANSLASPVAAITRRGKRPRGTRVIGTGPFVLKSLNRKKRELRLSAWERHHRGRAYVDRLRLRWYLKPDSEPRAYEVGELHISFRGEVAFTRNKPKYETFAAEGQVGILAYLGFGRSHAALLRDRDFRRAVSLAIGRSSMTKLGSGETILPSLRPDAMAAGSSKASDLSAQLDRAKASLGVAAARHLALSQRSRLNLQILVNRSRLDDIDIADKVLAALDKIGVRATVVEVSADVFDKRVRRGACDFYVGQLVAPVANREAALLAAFSAGGDNWARAHMTKAPLELTSASSEFRRRLPIIPLFHRAVRAHYRSDVFGLEFDGAGQLEWAELFLFGSAKRN